MSPKTILVIGATGNQGRGVVQHSLSAGHSVSAFVRNPASSAAVQLAEQGASLVTGDLDDLESLRNATQNVDAVFFTEVQTGKPEADFQRMENIILAAKESSTISHIILGTALKTGQHESFPGWESGAHPMKEYWLNKHALENRVREVAEAKEGGRWTIVRPGHFLQNLLPPVRDFMFPAFKEERVLRVAYRPGTELPLVDARDVGIVVAAAVKEPERFANKAVDVAVEVVTVEQLAGKIGKVVGEEVKVEFLDDEVVDGMIKEGHLGAASSRWADEVPGGDGVNNCREQLGALAEGLTSVDAFLKENEKAILA
ncbi:uncharacterized protein AKAW2_70189A [Aspergillus luchuensis]|uniref:NAD dependent epimerase/dehydratase n=1 Tax=Aspergillus kawachii TaxID=1069201 RepID=A0A146FGK5_ASPKA|nr:uncharacterized protein AKAW2_70189A [Aspergillus luchuensis]BCS03311.1 hypothetical protein AKAW2_70189A [Aspergillus luchuensis]BCS14939.1 hypothetical protein ALUC_70172A [Aspergillus luchuensis]GAA84841.1 NAD dependent epimerase/dehydratase [Aspergillus luchuensis IFO 4308]GAT24553.1 NAD dependent epimerase/dehydratase [Aspergillus luchuensis]